MAGRPAGEQDVVVDERPRDIRDDVDRDGQDQQTGDHPDNGQAELCSGPEPVRGRRRSGRWQQGGGLTGRWGRRQGPEAEPGSHDERDPGEDADEGKRRGHGQWRHRG